MASSSHAPASYAQERQYRTTQGLLCSNIVLAFRLRPSAAATWPAVVEQLSDRHELLRTTLGRATCNSVEQVAHGDASRPTLAVQAAPATSRRGEYRYLRVLMNEEARTPFRLSRFPLARFRLVGLRDGRAFALIVLSHVIADAWSAGRVVSDVRAMSALMHGRADRPRPIRQQYAEFAREQRRPLTREAAAYWRSELASVHLAEAKPPGPIRGRRRFVEFALPDVRRGAVSFAAPAYYLATFAAILSRLLRTRDLLIACFVSNRSVVSIETVGCYADVSVVRLQLGPTAAGMALVGDAARALSELRDHPAALEEQLRAARLPDASVDGRFADGTFNYVRSLPRRARSGTAPVDTYDYSPVLEWDEFRASARDVAWRGSGVSLRVSASEASTGAFDAPDEEFGLSRIRALAAQYVRALSRLQRDPMAKIGDLL